jgi:hypothetical protein
MYIKGTRGITYIDISIGGIGMDPITVAIVGAIGAGAMSGLTETSKTAITDAYTKLKDLLARKFGARSQVMQAVDQLEAKPDSTSGKEALQEEVIAVNAGQDTDVLTAANYLLDLIQAQQANPGKFNIQNNAPVQGQNFAEYQHIEQHFGNPPKA